MNNWPKTIYYNVLPFLLWSVMSPVIVFLPMPKSDYLTHFRRISSAFQGFWNLYKIII